VRESRYREPEFWLILAILLLMVHSFIRVWAQKVRIDRLEKRIQTIEEMTPGATEYR
jgi:hypothetical protein